MNFVAKPIGFCFGALVIFSTFSVNCFAKAKTSAPTNQGLETIKYETELCACTAKFDPKVVSRAQIQNAFEIGKNSTLSAIPGWIKLGTADTQRLKAMRSDIETLAAKQSARFESLDLPPGAIWGGLKKRIAEDDQLTADLNMRMIDFLLSKDEKALTQDYRGKKIPAECKMSAEKVPGPLNKQTQASVIEAVSMGWYNCMNENLRNEPDDNAVDEAREALRNSFKQRKCQCDEP